MTENHSVFGSEGRARRKRAQELEQLRRPVELHEVMRSDSWPYAPVRRKRWTAYLPLLLSIIVTMTIMTSFVAFHPGSEASRVRRMLGFGAERILPAIELPTDTGSYAFSDMQIDGRTPVSYDPCRFIEVEINPDGAPEEYRDFVDTSIDRITEATGFAFDLIGTTNREPDLDDISQSRRPVLVAWATEDEAPTLQGDVAGFAGSLPRKGSAGRLVYIHGQVVLDIDTFDNPSIANNQLQSIVDHEFAHLAGLAHVDDPAELMYPQSSGVTRFGSGDLRGLAELGQVPCE